MDAPIAERSIADQITEGLHEAGAALIVGMTTGISKRAAAAASGYHD